jgi:hypothetical protein
LPVAPLFGDNKKMDLEGRLCRRFCAYYKPSKDETLACRGFLEVRRLAGEGGRFSFRDRRRSISRETADALRGKLCTACPFFKEDCDFILKSGKAPPCGGFLLLGQLVDEGAIAIDEVGEPD